MVYIMINRSHISMFYWLMLIIIFNYRIRPERIWNIWTIGLVCFVGIVNMGVTLRMNIPTIF